ncbi:MAG: hypothetical protein M1522_03330 [Actinobacteria bacterium]|nr:hypothetical protein [Actinomycetota bacterium]
MPPIVWLSVRPWEQPAAAREVVPTSAGELDCPASCPGRGADLPEDPPGEWVSEVVLQAARRIEATVTMPSAARP